MARPKKSRRICEKPLFETFGPVTDLPREEIVMSLDEYECIRLMDYENISQEECAVRMNIARTTVTQIYDEARKKMAQCLIRGYRLRIEGGSIEICDGSAGCAACMHVAFGDERKA